MKIRPATAEDLPAIREIYNEAVATTTATYDEEPQSLEARKAWFQSHRESNHPVFVAELDGGKIAAWASLSAFHPRVGYRFTVENSIYVRSECRGQGIGHQLLANLVDAARQCGYRAVIALIDGDNTVSIRMHEKFGFVQAAFLRKVGFKFDRWLDVVYLQLDLHPDDSGKGAGAPV